MAGPRVCGDRPCFYLFLCERKEGGKKINLIRRDTKGFPSGGKLSPQGTDEGKAGR